MTPSQIASALGKLAKGVKKTITPERRVQLQRQAAEMNRKRAEVSPDERAKRLATVKPIATCPSDPETTFTIK